MKTDDKLQLRIEERLGKKRFYKLLDNMADSDNIETTIEGLLEGGTEPIDLLLVLARYSSVLIEQIEAFEDDERPAA